MLYDTLLVIDAQGQIAGRYRTPLRRRDLQRTWDTRIQRRAGSIKAQVGSTKIDRS